MIILRETCKMGSSLLAKKTEKKYYFLNDRGQLVPSPEQQKEQSAFQPELFFTNENLAVLLHIIWVT